MACPVYPETAHTGFLPTPVNVNPWPQAWLYEWRIGTEITNGTAVTTNSTCVTNALTTAWPMWIDHWIADAQTQVWLKWVEARASDGTVVPLTVPRDVAENAAELTRRADAVLTERQAVAATKARAEAALDAQLTEDQRAQLRRDGFFVVRGSAGGEYRLRQGEYGRCKRVDGGRTVEHLCVHPVDGDYPDADALLAVKLLLEADEQRLRTIANITRAA